MGFHGECGRGWSARCAASKGPKCRCRCGGANHGRLAQAGPSQTTRDANFTIEKVTDGYIAIRDLGPWDRHMSVTNDAEGVVERLASRLGNRRLFYYDSGGRLDELVVRDGRFVGFAPGGPVNA
jgi:hypothetical protein